MAASIALACGGRAVAETGDLPNLSSPSEKNNSVFQKGKSPLYNLHPVPLRGACARHERGAGCGDAMAGVTSPSVAYEKGVLA